MKTQTTPSTGNAGKLKFTGGEWVKVKTRDGYIIQEKELHERGFSDKIAEIYDYSPIEAEANVALIVNAPAMYEALEKATLTIKICAGNVKPSPYKDALFEQVNKLTALLSRIEAQK